VNVTTTSARSHRAQAFLRDIRSPEWGIAGQGFRFALSGSLVAIVYVSVTSALHDLLAVRFQIALAIGFATGVALHFTLQRVFVWRHYEKFALAVHHQAARYILVCGSQYGITALSTSLLPALLDLPVEVIYLTTMLSLTALNFAVLRNRVFFPITVGEGEAA
jgi:putative flippase GtrA